MQLSGLINFSIVALLIITVLVIFLRRCLYRKLKKLIVRTERSLRDSEDKNNSPSIDKLKKTSDAESKSSSVNISKEEKDRDAIEEGNTNDLINKLEERYTKASDRREQVNTLSLIDSIYKEETIFCLGKEFDCDWAEGITRILPNLLIAFGLIGTFIGITQNLTSISTILAGIDKNNLDSGKLIEGLQQPLEAMGIAFLTSLVGLTLGAVMTMANTYWNTNIAKNQLFASLEDYLDNSYNKGDTRLYQAIREMAANQESFLTRFHEKVSESVEKSFGNVADRIAKECTEITNIARENHTKFSKAAETISTGASTFKYAANSLNNQNQIISDSLREFRGGVEIFQRAATQLEQNNIVQNIDRVIGELNTSQQAFTNSTQTLESSLVGITSSNQTAAQLAQSVYKTLQTSASQMSGAAETIGAGAIIFQQSTTAIEAQTQTFVGLMPQLKTGVKSFVTAANKVQGNNIIENLDTVVANLSTTQQAFANSSQILADGVQGIMISHQEAIDLAKQVYDGLEMSTTGIQEGANKFVDAAQLIHDSSLAVDLTAAANSWQTAQAEFADSTAVFSQAAQIIQPVAAQLEPAIASIDRSISGLQQFGEEVVTLSQNTLQVSESTRATVSEIDRNYHELLNNTELSVQNLGEINQSSWQELRNILNHRIEADNQRSDRSIESLKEYITQMSLNERESLSKLLAMIDKLESRLSFGDTAPEKSSSFFNDKSN